MAANAGMTVGDGVGVGIWLSPASQVKSWAAPRVSSAVRPTVPAATKSASRVASLPCLAGLNCQVLLASGSSTRYCPPLARPQN